ncbi:MAG: serine/threonine-protein kinase, partial [Angustibacter sp.]
LFDERYRPIARIGGGSFGEVWRAEDTTTGRVVALKLIEPTQTTPDMAWQEATRLTSLESPHLVCVHGAALAVDVPYIDMALAERSVAAEVGPLGTDPGRAVRWAQQVARGLQLCHARQLVHRDVKPDNILLSRVGNALLGDFGVAALMAADGTASEHGDMEIRAPEAFFGGNCSALGDVYSLGITLFYLLCGRYPHRLHEYATYDDFARAVLGGIPNIRDVAPHVNRTLAAVINKATATDPSARIQSAAELDQALARVRGPRRIVQRVSPHQPDAMCWDLSAPTKGAGRRMHLCAISTGLTTTTIDFHYADSGLRVRTYCATVPTKQLPTRLRAVFQQYC